MFLWVDGDVGPFMAGILRSEWGQKRGKNGLLASVLQAALSPAAADGSEGAAFVDLATQVRVFKRLTCFFGVGGGGGENWGLPISRRLCLWLFSFVGGGG